MSYSFIPNMRYRMPVHFGPSLGPRQGVDDRRYENIDTPNETVVLATFEAQSEQLEKLIPPGFTLREPHTITFMFSYLKNVEWLAGRGFNTFAVLVPVTYKGEQETVEGDLMLVVWENNADCIITGREDLGVSKIYCDIPEPQLLDKSVICRASWDGFEFANLTLSNLKSLPLDDLPDEPDNDGVLHYKYIPKTGFPGESDAEYAVLLPSAWPNTQMEKVQVAEKTCLKLQESTWEQLPTMVHIVNALSALTLGECVSSALLNTHGGKDLSDIRIIR